MPLPDLWVVVPCCRSDRIRWTVVNFLCQRYERKRLIIVENGEAIGACHKLGLCPTRVITSDAHQSHARNEGVAEVRRLGGGWIAMCDDDDWYGPNYLDEVATAILANSGDVIGKHRHFVAFPDRGLYLFGERNQMKPALAVNGPTICFRAEEAVDFPVQSEAEEVAFCACMRDRGARIFATSVYNFLYLRGNQNTWHASPEHVAACSINGDAAYWFGDVDFRIVTGEIPWRDRVRCRFENRSPELPPPILDFRQTPWMGTNTSPEPIEVPRFGIDQETGGPHGPCSIG